MGAISFSPRYLSREEIRMAERERDQVWDALIEVCGYTEPYTTDERGRANTARKELMSLYGEEAAFVLPAMIRERAEAWKRVYPEIALTPQALTGNWSSIIGKAEALNEQQAEREKGQRKATNQHAKSGCTTCGDDHIVSVGTDATGNELTAPCPDC